MVNLVPPDVRIPRIHTVIEVAVTPTVICGVFGKKAEVAVVLNVARAAKFDPNGCAPAQVNV